MTKATSIDYAVSGYVRHRFLRALWAAGFVLVALFLISIPFYNVYGYFTGRPGAPPLIQAPLFILIEIVWWWGAGVTTWVLFELPHRRLTALGLIALWSYLLWHFALDAWTQLNEYFLFAGADIVSLPPFLVFAGIVFVFFPVLGLLVSLELLLGALWQLTATHEGFVAARGWRSGPGSGRLLAMPAFLSSFKRGGAWLVFIYFLIAVVNLGLFGVVPLPLFLLGTQVEGTTTAVPVVAGLVGAVVVALVLGRVLGFVAERSATKLYQRVREWDPRKPVVFLRTFDQDDSRLRVRGGSPISKFPAGVGRARTLDEILLEHATPYGPVIAIGDPRDPTPPLGAARIFVPERGAGWQDVVRGLVGASKVVVMCPNDTEGVKWELDLIAQSEQLNVIFVANPELTRETNVKLFAQLAPPGETPEISPRQTPIAAFRHPGKGWRVITARRTGLEAYTIALNIALQRMFGPEGVEIPAEQAGAQSSA